MNKADLSDRLDTKESLETENVQTKIENEQKSSLLEIGGMQGKEALENEIMNLKK